MIEFSFTNPEEMLKLSVIYTAYGGNLITESRKALN
jgi:hypothetical protein